MTELELQDYNKLDEKGKDAYNLAIMLHPEWSHAQKLTFAIITSGISVTPIPQPEPGPQTLLEIVMEKARDFMQEKFPRIYVNVKQTFTNIIDSIKSGLIRTWNEIMSWFS